MDVYPRALDIIDAAMGNWTVQRAPAAARFQQNDLGIT
jgi:hypothetical protein